MRQVVEPEQLRLFEVGPNMTEIRAEAERLERCIRAESTLECYASDWRTFTKWCAIAGRTPLPSSTDTLRLWVASRLREGRKVTTVERGVAAVAHYHRLAGETGLDTRAMGPLYRGARRSRKEQPKRRQPFEPAQITALCRRFVKEGSPRARRDRLLLLLGITTGLRAANLSALEMNDLRLVPEGIVVRLRSSKTDQEGRGRDIGVFRSKHTETDPIHALNDWLEVRNKIHGADAKKGRLFVRVREGYTPHEMTPIWRETVNQLVKEWARSLGLDADDYGGHSLRASCVTIADLGGASTIAIMERTGHKTVEMVKQYLRNRDPFARGNLFAHAL